jgi:hypothetical protein
MKANGVAIVFAGLVISGAVGTAVENGGPAASAPATQAAVPASASPQVACKTVTVPQCAQYATGHQVRRLVRVHHNGNVRIFRNAYRVLHPIRTFRRFFWWGRW